MTRASLVAVWAAALVAAGALSPGGCAAQSAGARRETAERQVQAALARGDTAAALEAQGRVLATLTPGSAAWRGAKALAIRLAAPTAGAEALRAAVDSFRARAPQAPELDGVAAAAARVLLARDDTAGAAAVLEGVDGPESTLEQGYLILSAGDVAAGRTALLLSVSGLDPAEATRVIQYAGLLGRLSPPWAELLARAGPLAHVGRGVAAARLLEVGADSLLRVDSLAKPAKGDSLAGRGADAGGDSLPGADATGPDDFSAVLAEAARMAEGGKAQRGDSLAARLRARLLKRAPDAEEASDAALELARYRARTPAGRDGAIRLLTDLITRDPAGVVVPQARRELERLQAGGGR